MNPVPSRLQALILDVDGTLAETEEQGHRVAFNLAFDEAGLGWQWDNATYDALLTVAGGRERIAHWFRQVDPELASGADFEALVQRLHQRKTAHYLALVDQGRIGLRPGVARLLGEARSRGVTLAIATTTTEINVRRLLEVALGGEAWSWFAVVGAGDAVANKKPAPDIYRWVLDRLACPPQNAVAIEDSAIGAGAAIAAGIATVVTRSRQSHAETMPDAVLADLDGLGEREAPAQGRVGGRDWAGVVGVDALAGWLASEPNRQPIGRAGADAALTFVN
jgi:beta-phosphoglucomutase-like phosphatase (HAD superfamily)